MYKLIIPNSINQFISQEATFNDYEKQLFLRYATRNIWIMQPGDATLLPKKLSPNFLKYFEETRKTDIKKFNLVEIDKPFKNLSDILQNPYVIKKLKEIITNPENWHILPAMYNKSIIDLAEKLNIKINKKWLNLVNEGFAMKMSGKSEFRRMAISCNVPISEGVSCSSLVEFLNAVDYFYHKTHKIMIKRDYGAGGMGNIYLSNEKYTFSGTYKTVLIEHDNNLKQIAENIWKEEVNEFNKNLIVEVFYPDSKAFTCELNIPENSPPEIMNYGEIIMGEKSFVGLKTPASIKPTHLCQLIDNSLRLSNLAQLSGYVGYLSCDAIETKEGNILFTEINARMSGAMYVYALAEEIFGKNYMDKIITMLRNDIKIPNFDAAYQVLKKENLLFDGKSGVIFLYVDNNADPVSEILILDRTEENINIILNKLKKLL